MAGRFEVTSVVHEVVWVEVRSGLDAGDEVVTGPYRVLRKLKAGDPVRLADKKKDDAKKAAESKESGSAD